MPTNDKFWCANCQSYEPAWISEPSKCWACNQYTLANESEQNQLKSLVKQKTSLTNPQEIVRFSTNWNNNLATVINSDIGYWVHLLVYDKASNSVKAFPTSFNCSKWGQYSREKYDYLSDAQNEASWLREKLKYENNPILYVHPRANEYTTFANLVSEPYVINNQVGSCTKDTDVLVYVSYSSSTPNDLDRHFKPLDIVWVKCLDRWIGKRFYHVGVYLGKGELIHFSKENNRVEKTTWKRFLNNTTRKIIRYHPIIPFKNYKQIIGEAVWAKDNNYQKGDYMLLNRNCEHFANSLVYGIYYSQQMAEFKKSSKIVAANTVGGLIGGLGYGLLLAPFTGGASLLVAPAIGAATGATMGSAALYADINDNIRDTFCLRNKLNNSSFKKKSDCETRELEERYEASVEQHIKTSDCIIM